jgi:hypothetical protein
MGSDLSQYSSRVAMESREALSGKGECRHDDDGMMSFELVGRKKRKTAR